MWYNCSQKRHFTWDYVNPHTRCTYYYTLDYATQDCPQLLVEWKEKSVGNVHMVTVEQRGEGSPRIFIVTRGGDHLGRDASTSSVNQQHWVCKVANRLCNLTKLKRNRRIRKLRKILI